MSPSLWAQHDIEEEFEAFKDSVFYTYKNQLDNAESSRNASAIREAHIDLARFYKQTQIYTEAVNHYNAALTQNADRNSQVTATLKNELAEIYIVLNNYKKATDLLNSSLSYSEKHEYLSLKAKSYQLLGTCREKQKQPQKALDFQQQSLAIYRNLKDLSGEATVLENIGSIYEDLEEYDKAYVYFESAYIFFKEADDEAQVNALNNLADIYRKTGRYTEAIEKTKDVLELAFSYDNAHQIGSAYKDLAKAYALAEDYKQAHHYALAYQDIVEKEFYSQNFNQLNALQTIFDTKEKESQINLLEERNNTAETRLAALVIILLLFFASVIIFFYFLKRKRQAKLDLQVYKQRALEAELETKAVHEQNLQNEIQLKTATLSKYSLSLAQKNKLIEDVSASLQKISSRKRIDYYPSKLIDLSNELEVHLKEGDEWSQFMILFEDIHPHFSQKLNEKALQILSATEVRLALLLRLNLSSKEIAAILRITPDSVRVARYRLRKKLPLESQDDLVDFMLKL
ncbi:DNA-binding transcriptional regulator, CsgD family [Leeuwenhoekiella marinoflava DSM 3653]|uniref:DNA-binding CsgD family transcriptional regulator n=3 Tax=Leeuwenhoekiella marinoflava TaxID=988 RepID=A0A4Q0PSD2_9FLAO|nr:DNA-binding CsgD family transcriptional regulator [Leeuwenhoekiella marinoflava]SHE42817.1 DNA-binding transcriptional regulator, CsgD family [Leeuwenhoekiella marinoflava DSM 3653]